MAMQQLARRISPNNFVARSSSSAAGFGSSFVRRGGGLSAWAPPPVPAARYFSSGMPSHPKKGYLRSLLDNVFPMDFQKTVYVMVFGSMAYWGFTNDPTTGLNDGDLVILDVDNSGGGCETNST